MPSARSLVGDTLGFAGRTVARSLHSRWHRLSASRREPLEPLARDVKERALDLRGAGDPEAAGRELEEASRRLADAMVDSAEADPEVSEIEVRALRDDLARELERLATAEISASRGSRVRQDSP